MLWAYKSKCVDFWVKTCLWSYRFQKSRFYTCSIFAKLRFYTHASFRLMQILIDFSESVLNMRNYFNLLYLFLGISNGCGPKYQSLTIAFRIHMILFTLIVTFKRVHELVSIKRDRTFEVAFNAFSWVFFIVYSIRTSTIRKKFDYLCQSKMTFENSVSIRSIERRYTSVLLIMLIIPSIAEICLASHVDIVMYGLGNVIELPYCLRVTLSYWYWTVMGLVGINGPLIMTIDYLCTFQKLYLIKREFMLSMTMGLPMKNARKRWREICDLKSLFEQIYSITPLLKFIQTFLQTNLYILTLHNIQALSFRTWLLPPMIMWLSQTLVTIYLVYVIDRQNSRLKLIHEFIMKQYVGSNDAEIDKLLDDVKENHRFEMTAYGLFVLNKSVISEFGSALVTFSVLFIQLKG